MRTCPYCGKEYPDDMVVCPNDQRVLLDKKIQWDDNNSDETNKPSKKFWIKIGAASLAYLPMIVFIITIVLVHSGVFSESGAKPIIIGCGIFNFPAFSILSLIKTFNVSWLIFVISALILMFLWSSFMAWFFWRPPGLYKEKMSLKQHVENMIGLPFNFDSSLALSSGFSLAGGLSDTPHP